MRVFFGVYLDDGCLVPCQGVCRDLRVDLGACQLTIDGYFLELGGVDLFWEWNGKVI